MQIFGRIIDGSSLTLDLSPASSAEDDEGTGGAGGGGGGLGAESGGAGGGGTDLGGNSPRSAANGNHGSGAAQVLVGPPGEVLRLISGNGCPRLDFVRALLIDDAEEMIGDAQDLQKGLRSNPQVLRDTGAASVVTSTRSHRHHQRTS